MDRDRKCLERSKKMIKKKKAPIKVVYISSPMRVTTSAAMFRALVQRLTGRDSDIDASAAAMNSYSSSSAFESAGDSSSMASVRSFAATTSDDSGGSAGSFCPSISCIVEQDNGLVAPVEVFDDEAFDAQLLESFSVHVDFATVL